MVRFHRLRFFAVLLLAALCCTVAAHAIQDSKPELPANPDDLVRRVIDFENRAHVSRGFYTWTATTVKPKGSQTKIYVDTPQGVIGRLVALNGRPLTLQQREREESRLDRLLDPAQMRDKRKEQKQDDERTTKLVRAIPDAFFFKYTGTEQTPDGHTLVNLTFTPNPNFNPPTREALVFEGMRGTMTIDATAQHIKEIDGRLFRDVTIGWGILGRLYKGGRFYVEQADVHNGHWDQVKMILRFNGKALLFKTIHIEETDTAWGFRSVEKMDVSQALDFLRKASQNHDAQAQVRK